MDVGDSGPVCQAGGRHEGPVLAGMRSGPIGMREPAPCLRVTMHAMLRGSPTIPSPTAPDSSLAPRFPP